MEDQYPQRSKSMKATKTLNIDAGIHRRLKCLAADSGEALGDFAEAVLEAGLAHLEDVRRLLAGRTNPAAEPEKE